MARGKKKETLTPEERLQAALVPECEQPYKVPENWCWTKVGVLSGLYRGVSYKKQDAHAEQQEQDCLILRGGNVLEGALETETSDNIYVNRNLVQEDQLLQPYDVIIVSSTGSSKVIGRAGVSYTGYDNVAFGAFLTLVRPNDGIVKPFIAYYFQSDVYRNRIRGLAAGVNINNIKANYITESPIPLPPFSEQQRIVDRIESLFAKLDEAKQKAQDALDSFETRKAAILHKAFTGELTAQWRKEHGVGMESWERLKLGEIGTLERGRSQHRPRNDPRLFGGPYPFIQTGDVASANVYITEHHQTLSEFGMEQSRMFSAGTLCITIAANIGDVAILSYDCCFPDSVVGFIPNSRSISKFIYYMMSVLQKELEDNAPATAQKNINLKILNAVEMNIPPVTEQTEIVRILDDLLAKEQQAKEAAEGVLEQIDLIKKAILARAFRGELGTNDPSEESAVELLKRVIERGEKA